MLSAGVVAFSLGTGGCAAQDEGQNADPAASEDELRQKQLSDQAIEGKLRGILTDVLFTSESDAPYVVFEGDTVTEGRLTTKLVRSKLRAAVKERSSSKRDIGDTTCRSSRLNVSQTIAAGEGAEVSEDPGDDISARHDRQLMIALKTMRAQLKGVVGFTFGTNESGDQDDFGPVLYVYVGISKTTGKLIAIMTEAVYT